MAEAHDDVAGASTTDVLPISPSLGPALEQLRAPRQSAVVNRRVAFISVVSVGVAICAGFVAQALTRLIGLITNLAYYGRASLAFSSPAGNHLGYWAIGVPVLGSIFVGLMARYGSKAIRGHGIPEAMEQVLFNQSRIPARMTLLKPLSAAIAIGTGGPFGAEGPIIATGGALGSLVGQILRITADERKTLLAAGAAAGMSATFGSPVSAVLLAIELLLFEYRPRSIIPVALASATAASVRMAFSGSAPIFALDGLTPPSGGALAFYVVVGAVVGVFSVGVTRAVYWVEDQFEKLPFHWMWWPAVGAVAVGVVGVAAPHTLGVGYDNIERIISGHILGSALVTLFVLKFISWSIALGSGTSGGTLAPLFTIGGGLGSILGAAGVMLVPGVGIDVRIAALVGMAAIFAGASHALLASVVFAFETTRQPIGLLPLLGGCTAAFLVSTLLMKHSIMTEKIARRGARVPTEYAADFLDTVLVGSVMSTKVVTLEAHRTLEETRRWIASAVDARHQGFPVLDGQDGQGALVGVVMLREIVDATQPPTLRLGDLVKRPPTVVYDDCSLRQAADLMASEDVGRLPVVKKEAERKVIGVITRSDLLRAHRRRLDDANTASPGMKLSDQMSSFGLRRRRPDSPSGSGSDGAA